MARGIGTVAWRRLVSAGSAAFVLATATGAAAQIVPGRPAQGALPTREQVSPPPPQPAPAGGVNIDSRGALEQQNCPFEDSPLRLNLTTVNFLKPDGGAVAPGIAATLAKLTLPTGDQSIRIVCDIRDAANEALRRAGWVASVQVPPQEITGELRLDVIAARIVETRVRGNPGPYESLLRERIADLEALDPLNERAAEKLLLLTGDVPGLDVQLSLRPAGRGTPGEVIGDLTVSYRRFAILGNAQNYNSRLLGRETGYLRGEVYGLTGYGDVTYVGVSSTADVHEQIIAQFGHVMTLDPGGTTFGGRLTYAWSRPDIGALDLKTTTLVAGFDLRRPLIRSIDASLTLNAGVDYVDQDSKITAIGQRIPLTSDRLRVGFLGLDGDARGLRPDGLPEWVVSGGIVLRKGFDIFGATPRGNLLANSVLPSRIDGRSTAFVVRADFDAEYRFSRIFSIATAVQGQWTDQALLNYEEFSLGNLTIGRGYDPGSNSGDRAIGIRAEVRADVVRRGDAELQLFGFADTVRLTNLDPNATEVDRTLRSYGGGLRFRLPNTAVMEVTYAHPRDPALRIDQRRPPDRVLVSLTFQFRPNAR